MVAYPRAPRRCPGPVFCPAHLGKGKQPADLGDDSPALHRFWSHRSLFPGPSLHQFAFTASPHLGFHRHPARELVGLEHRCHSLPLHHALHRNHRGCELIRRPERRCGYLSWLRRRLHHLRHSDGLGMGHATDA